MQRETERHIYRDTQIHRETERHRETYTQSDIET